MWPIWLGRRLPELATYREEEEGPRHHTTAWVWPASRGCDLIQVLLCSPWWACPLLLFKGGVIRELCTVFSGSPPPHHIFFQAYSIHYCVFCHSLGGLGTGTVPFGGGACIGMHASCLETPSRGQNHSAVCPAPGWLAGSHHQVVSAPGLATPWSARPPQASWRGKHRIRRAAESLPNARSDHMQCQCSFDCVQ